MNGSVKYTDCPGTVNLQLQQIIGKPLDCSEVVDIVQLKWNLLYLVKKMFLILNLYRKHQLIYR